MAWPNFHPEDETGGRQSGGSTGCNENAQLAPSEKSLIEECGWKDGDSGNPAGRKTLVQRKNQRTRLTPTGLLMEGYSCSVRGSLYK
jgi:hypothetical protein